MTARTFSKMGFRNATRCKIIMEMFMKEKIIEDIMKVLKGASVKQLLELKVFIINYIL